MNVQDYFNITMDSTNAVLSKVSCLEELPNELFFLIFSHLKSDMVIQTFINLNRRFQSIILQYSRDLVFSSDIEPFWVKKHMLSIKDYIETITLSFQFVGSVFSHQYSYLNLRSIIIYSDIAWQVELNVENEFPMTVIVSAFNALVNCSFIQIQYDSSKISKSIINNKETTKSAHEDSMLPCSAIRRLWILECHEGNLRKLCEMAPELTYLRTWLRPSRILSPFLQTTSSRITRPIGLTELYVKITEWQSFNDLDLLIGHCRGFLRRIMLDLGEDLMIDGRKLETLLTSCEFLKDLSFISRFSKEKINISNLLHSFQSQWWLDTRRPPVLIHETDFNYLWVMSIPCSFSNILKNVQFSSDLASWHLNKTKLDALPIHSIKTSKISLSNKKPISFDFLRFAARIFDYRKQTLACRRWGLIFEEDFFRQFLNQSMVETILPNITRMNIAHVNGLSPSTFVVWLLLAPNVRILDIEYLSFCEIMEWVIELKDVFLKDHQRLKRIVQRIQRINISSLCYNCNEQFKLKIFTELSELFSNAIIY